MISAIVVTHNSAHCIGRCLSSLRDACGDAEILVVDNASHDDTVAQAVAVDPALRVIVNDENVGFGRACNAGAAAASESHVLFLNPDVEVTAIDSRRLRTMVNERPFGLVAPLFDGEADRRRAESAWFIEVRAHTVDTLRPREWSARSSPARSRSGWWVSGGMVLASREEFLQLGGFDPRFFLYYEDRDLSRRYRDAALPIRTTDAIRGRHLTGTSSRSPGTEVRGDDLAVQTMAWSLLGWLQYLSIHEGEQTAARAARATLVLLRGVRLVARGGAAVGWRRAREKARQLERLRTVLAQTATAADPPFCADALTLIRGHV